MGSGTHPALLVVATALGGAISFLTTYLMARRAEKAAGRAAARVLDDELGEAEEMLDAALIHDVWWPGVAELPSESWREHRSALALLVPAEEWGAVGQAFSELSRTVRILALDPLPPAEMRPLEGSERERLQTTLEKVRPALAILDAELRTGHPLDLRARRLARKLARRDGSEKKNPA